MLRRQPTTLGVTAEDVVSYEDRRTEQACLDAEELHLKAVLQAAGADLSDAEMADMADMADMMDEDVTDEASFDAARASAVPVAERHRRRRLLHMQQRAQTVQAGHAAGHADQSAQQQQQQQQQHLVARRAGGGQGGVEGGTAANGPASGVDDRVARSWEERIGVGAGRRGGRSG